MDIHQMVETVKKDQMDNSIAGDFARGVLAGLSALYNEVQLQDVINWWNWADDSETPPFWGLVDGKWEVISVIWKEKENKYNACKFASQEEVNPSRFVRLIANIPTPNEVL